MPHRTSKHGTFKLDRLFQGVGRINLASGATTAAEFHKRDALLTRLYDQGRLDLLKAIRARPQFGSTPVIMITTETEMDQMTSAIEAGANEYVMKPFTSQILLDKLRMAGVRI